MAKKNRWFIVCIALLLALGSIFLVGCGSGGDKGKKSEISFKGITVPIPGGFHGMAEETYSDIALFKGDKKTVEKEKDKLQLSRVEVSAYALDDTPSYAGAAGTPVDYATLQPGFTEYWAEISGTTPAEEFMIGNIPFMKTETSTNGLPSWIMAGVVDGYVIEIKVIGEDLIGTKEAQSIMESIQFDHKAFFESESE